MMELVNSFEEHIKGIKRGFVLFLLGDLSPILLKASAGILKSLSGPKLEINRYLENSILILTVDCENKRACIWERVGDSYRKRDGEFSAISRMLNNFAHQSLVPGEPIKLKRVLCDGN